jgi:hypothetical protein
MQITKENKMTKIRTNEKNRIKCIKCNKEMQWNYDYEADSTNCCGLCYNMEKDGNCKHNGKECEYYCNDRNIIDGSFDKYDRLSITYNINGYSGGEKLEDCIFNWYNIVGNKFIFNFSGFFLDNKIVWHRIDNEGQVEVDLANIDQNDIKTYICFS